MPEYLYEAMDATGMEVKDIIEAPSPKEAMNAIRAMGLFTTKISPKNAKAEKRQRNSAFWLNTTWMCTMVFVCGVGVIDAGLGIPLMAVLVVMIVLIRPKWFFRLVRQLYRKRG